MGRPLRAAAVLAVFGAGWLAGRAPVLLGQWQAGQQLIGQQLAALTVPAARPVAGVAMVRQAVARQVARPVAPRPAPLRQTVPAPEPAMVPQIVPQIVPMPVLVFAPAAAPATVTLAAAVPPPADAPPPTGFALATAAYAAQARGRRAEAHRLFQAALAQQPDNAGWRQDDRQLAAHWQGEAFALLRAAGPVGPTAAPVLGGGQMAASLAFRPRPLARRPLALVARAVAATLPDGSLDLPTAQAALGVRWQALPQLSVTVERLLPLGPAALADWNVRLAGGKAGPHWQVYAEAGALAQGIGYAGGQARWLPVPLLGGRVQAGAGLWAGAQGPLRNSPWLGRLDAGPALLGRLGPAQVEAGWRFRLAGNAAPGSGPAVVVSAGF